MRKLFFLVEGSDDERFVKAVFYPKLSGSYNVSVWQYSTRKKKKIKDFVRSIKQMKGHYVFLADLDGNKCKKMKIKKIMAKHPFLSMSNICVIVMEIESWYLAGITEELKKHFNLSFKVHSSTENIGKEKFYSYFNDSLSKIEVLVAILRNFKLNIALSRNSSLKYFVRRWGL